MVRLFPSIGPGPAFWKRSQRIVSLWSSGRLGKKRESMGPCRSARLAGLGDRGGAVSGVVECGGDAAVWVALLGEGGSFSFFLGLDLEREREVEFWAVGSCLVKF